jgi:predicted transcriptional regulator
LPPPRLLAAARALIDLSQRELAAAAGIATSLVARYEAGHSMLRSDSFGAILAVLHHRGVRFVEATNEITMGVLLLRQQAPTMRESSAEPPTDGPTA